ncbi:MAG: hypothetical protein ACQESK_01565 [Bacteroidota bacterium]
MIQHQFNLEAANFYAKKLPEKWIQYLISNKYFKLFVPKSLGGLECNLPQAAKKLEETARFHGSLGWIHNLGAGANYFCGFFEPETAQELFHSSSVITSGSGMVAGSFEQKENHLYISGEWQKCTGAQYATLFTGNALGNNEEVKTFILPAQQAKVHSTWTSFGLKASSSDSFVATKAKIPNRYTFEIGHVKSFSDYFVYHLPFELFARYCLSASFCGIAQGFVDQLQAFLPEKEYLKSSCQQLQHQLDELKSFLKETGCSIEDKMKRNNTISIEDQRTIANQLAERHFAVYITCNKLYYDGGILLSDETKIVHWMYRDLLTAIQHYMLKPKRD